MKRDSITPRPLSLLSLSNRILVYKFLGCTMCVYKTFPNGITVENSFYILVKVGQAVRICLYRRPPRNYSVKER